MSGIPFLCNFVDRFTDNSSKNYLTNFREILVNKLNLVSSNHHFSDKCVLILSRSLDLETDIVCIELLRKGIDYVRLNAEDVPHKLIMTNSLEQDLDTEYQISLDSVITNLSDISAVWLRNFDYGLIHSNNIDLSTSFIYQQWSHALRILYNTLECGWINRLEATEKANNRIQQLTHAKQVGFNIPSTLITNDPKSAHSFYGKHDGDIIVKVLHHHDIEIKNKVYSIYSHVVTEKDLSKFKDLIYAPCVLQKRIHNCSEIRVTVIKDKAFSVKLGSEELALKSADMHRIPVSTIPKNTIQLKKEDELRCIKLIDSLGLLYGAIDLLIDKDGKLFFLEVNPTGDWLWIEHQTNVPITSSVVNLIEYTVNSPSST